MTEAEAIASIGTARLRGAGNRLRPRPAISGRVVPDWDIPRQTGLTDRVPAGALSVAIRQVVLYSVSAPTGWCHVGQTALSLFEPEADADGPFLLRPGNEVIFERVSSDAIRNAAPDAHGGATSEPIR